VYVVLCNVLPGSGYRLHATSKIGEIRPTTQPMHKPQEAISGTLAALRSIATSLIEFVEVFRAIGITASTQGQAAPAHGTPRERTSCRCPSN
jgi:hypothetical protein